jgi:hypothetical protein
VTSRVRPASLFARLALLAALLLAVVPTVGRLLGTSAPVSAPHSIAMQMPMAMGHGMHDAMARTADASHPSAPTPSPHSGHDHDGDCAYCPLLGAMLATQALALDLPPAAAPRQPVQRAPATPRFAQPRSTLGSRGPPQVA